MPKFRLSVSGLSILMALALGLWEWFFFFYGGRWEGPLGWFAPNRLGFNLAWLNSCLSFLPASLNPIRAARIQRALHRRAGRDGLFGTARHRAHCDIWEARASGHTAAVGERVSGVVRGCD
jgi:hypothetical protein